MSDRDGHAQSTNMNASEGWIIFDPTKDGHAYRYGPSIIINADNSIDAWFASPGGKGKDGIHQWDWIRHKRSLDGGKTWGPETIVLKPTEGSKDRMSVCDPGVIRFCGYYYLGVTAVYDPQGHCNEVFVARSKTPTGPFEKWNGNGWGGSPAPIVAFKEPTDVWGAGEPSFVRKGGTLFIYYTIISKTANGRPINETHVAMAPANDPNWPAKMTYHGVAFDRVKGEDSSDVKYCDGIGRFIAVSTASRFSESSYIAVRFSVDGLHFTKPCKITDNIRPWCHNVGISGTPDGHIDLKDENFVAYAYSKKGGVSWAFWHTFLNPITIGVKLTTDERESDLDKRADREHPRHVEPLAEPDNR